MTVKPQPMVSVRDVPASSHWYQRVLGASSAHGGQEYEQLVVNGVLVLQLHHLEIDHHHGTIGDPGQPVGNGLALWFEVDEFDEAVERVHASDVHVETDVHRNPNAGHREVWLRDPDGYLVVLSGPPEPEDTEA